MTRRTLCPAALAVICLGACSADPADSTCEQPPWSEYPGRIETGGTNPSQYGRLVAATQDDLFYVFAAVEGISAIDVYEACDPRVADSETLRLQYGMDVGSPRSLFVVRSDDAGGRWTEPVRLSDGWYWAGDILDVAASRDDVYVAISEESEGGVYVRLIESHDGGMSWSSERVWDVANLGGDSVWMGKVHHESGLLAVATFEGIYDARLTVLGQEQVQVEIPAASSVDLAYSGDRFVLLTLTTTEGEASRVLGITDLGEDVPAYRRLDVKADLGRFMMAGWEVAAAATAGGLAVFVPNLTGPELNCIRIDLEYDAGLWQVVSEMKHPGAAALEGCGDRDFLTTQVIDGAPSPVVVGLWQDMEAEAYSDMVGFHALVGSGRGEKPYVLDHRFETATFETNLALAPSVDGRTLFYAQMVNAEFGVVTFE